MTLLPLILMYSESLQPAAATVASSDLKIGIWRAWLDCPGGELPFGLELRRVGKQIRGFLINGSERISIPSVRLDGRELTIDIDHYDSTIRAMVAPDGTRLDGRWKKRRGPDRWADVAFHAEYGGAPRFDPPPKPGSTEPEPKLSGRWSIKFSGSDVPAVGVFEFDAKSGEYRGTFLTTTGDYRYLAGGRHGDRLRLSVFDGAHAFLFDARLQSDGTLAGDFWAGTHWHETWTARRDPDARLSDGFKRTRWTDKAKLSDLAFPDLTGTKRTLDDPAFAGKARIIEIFGSWCPNCHDAAAYLKTLSEKYGPRGLVILGLAFEISGDFERDAAQVRKYIARYDVDYPILIAGLSDKAQASAAFGAVDRIRSFPTTIFMSGDGRVRAVYSGFDGPATGPANDRLRRQWESIIEELLAESATVSP